MGMKSTMKTQKRKKIQKQERKENRTIPRKKTKHLPILVYCRGDVGNGGYGGCMFETQ